MRWLGIGLICGALAGCGDKAADDASRAAAEKVIELKGKFQTVLGQEGVLNFEVPYSSAPTSSCRVITWPPQ